MSASNDSLVSIIIPTYNRAQLVMEAVKSVLNQTYQNFEIVIVDDGSTDHTARLLTRIKDERVRYYDLKNNQGAPAARNVGLEKAKGQFIAFLDSDDRWAPAKLAKQMAVFQANPRVGFVYTGIQYKSGQDERISIPKISEDMRSLILTKNVVGPTSSVLIKKVWLQQIGGFDLTLPSCQDWDLFIRLAQITEAAFVGEPLVYYFEHEGTRISTNAGAVVKGHLRIHKKHQQLISALSGKEKRKHYGNMTKILLKAGLLRIDKNIIGKSRSVMKQVSRFGFSVTAKYFPVLASKVIYYKKFGKRLNLKSPQTFNEKLMWLKLNEEDTLKVRCTDKFSVREYVRELGHANTLIDLYGVYETVEEIDFDQLPNRFVLKCTHGSGFNIICPDKNRLDIAQTKKQLKRWMKTDYSLRMGEPHYAKIKPRIIAERFLGEEGTENLPIDYKIHCFHGKPAILDIVLNRGTAEKKHIMLNDQWEIIPYTEDSIHFGEELQKPRRFGDMLSLAKEFSKAFTYVRVDFYYDKHEIYFGELTFTPGACADTDYVNGVDEKMGAFIDLSVSEKANRMKSLLNI